MPVSAINNVIGTPLIEIDSVASTNNYAMQLVHNGLAQHGTAIFAHEQTSGKGQRSRQWHSTVGENIILSVILNTSGLQVSSQVWLSMVTSLAAHDFFKSYAIDETSVKWPNDLYWRDRKAGGILIENVISGKEWQWAVIGIGININQVIFSEDISNAVSLKQITGKHYKPIELAKELCKKLQEKYELLRTGDSKTIVAAYNDVLYKKGQVVTFKKNSAAFKCMVKGVNSFGQLVAESATEQLFDVGEIQWVI